MEIGGYGFEKTEFMTVTEQIYECKSRKQDLELELDSEKFHQKYIPRRRELMMEQVMLHLPIVIILSIAVLGSFVAMALAFINPKENASGNVGLIAYALCLVFGGYADAKFIMQMIHMITLLRISVNKENAMRYAKKHDINTFQNDAAVSDEKVKLLEQQIASIDERIKALFKRQQEIMNDRQYQEEVLRKRGILFDEKPEKDGNESVTGSKFVLKEESVGTQDALQLHEFYCKEEQSIMNYIMQLEGKLQRINKEIVNIDDEFETIKKQIIFSFIIYILIAVIQSVFTGILSEITAVFCIILSFAYVIYFEKKCKRPILLYFVEHDSKLTQEYAFCNNMVPVRNKREELLELVDNCQKELIEIKKKKEEIIF